MRVVGRRFRGSVQRFGDVGRSGLVMGHACYGKGLGPAVGPDGLVVLVDSNVRGCRIVALEVLLVICLGPLG